MSTVIKPMKSVYFLVTKFTVTRIKELFFSISRRIVFLARERVKTAITSSLQIIHSVSNIGERRSSIKIEIQKIIRIDVNFNLIVVVDIERIPQIHVPRIWILSVILISILSLEIA